MVVLQVKVQKLNGKQEIKNYCDLSHILNIDESCYSFSYFSEYSIYLTFVDLAFTST